MSYHRFTRPHSCSPPPSFLSGKPVRTPRRPPSLSRLHWPHADDRRRSPAPWGLIMVNPSCFTIHKLRLLRFKHVFIPIPCSFLLLLSSLFFNVTGVLARATCKCSQSVRGHHHASLSISIFYCNQFSLSFSASVKSSMTQTQLSLGKKSAINKNKSGNKQTNEWQ